jgi:hypothetical protein
MMEKEVEGFIVFCLIWAIILAAVFTWVHPEVREAITVEYSDKYCPDGVTLKGDCDA